MNDAWPLEFGAPVPAQWNSNGTLEFFGEGFDDKYTTMNGAMLRQDNTQFDFDFDGLHSSFGSGGLDNLTINMELLTSTTDGHVVDKLAPPPQKLAVVPEENVLLQDKPVLTVVTVPVVDNTHVRESSVPQPAAVVSVPAVVAPVPMPVPAPAAVSAATVVPPPVPAVQVEEPCRPRTQQQADWERGAELDDDGLPVPPPPGYYDNAVEAEGEDIDVVDSSESESDSEFLPSSSNSSSEEDADEDEDDFITKLSKSLEPDEIDVFCQRLKKVAARKRRQQQQQQGGKVTTGRKRKSKLSSHPSAWSQPKSDDALQRVRIAAARRASVKARKSETAKLQKCEECQKRHISTAKCGLDAFSDGCRKCKSAGRTCSGAASDKRRLNAPKGRWSSPA